MHRVLSFTLILLGNAFAQNPADLFNKPPAEVDQALRARIAEFYQCHVNQQFRKAEQLVAEDTKDFFYNSNKPKYLSFEIVRIEYSKDFTRATATMVTEQYIMMPGFMDKPMKIPSPSTWKLENGKWVWYVDQEALKNTPFGKMTAGPGAPGGLPTALPTTPDFVLNKVKPDKYSVSLRPGESDQVKLTNTAPGVMDLVPVGFMEGIEVKFDRQRLNAGETATITIHAGDHPKPGTLNVRIEPTQEFIPIKIAVQ
jgi:hypothetical protein